ncbi:hypothetical protein AVDCRST_MAG92-3649 [uncultured Coleofasciculus sp.]|uniref:Uncharacterized protein n=1 Tax=uncultured Coleofasciculus sp. TaxID=1267456 RepID=A0A6J4JN81_9CYAN|nr:hypothetical protein AVDCRST_MAG92-3649 [uncultured Coleofasciculus sp.]
MIFKKRSAIATRCLPSIIPRKTAATYSQVIRLSQLTLHNFYLKTVFNLRSLIFKDSINFLNNPLKSIKALAFLLEKLLNILENGNK